MFAIVVTQHHLLGYIFQPYFLDEGEIYYNLHGLVSSKSQSFAKLTPEEKEVVALCEAFSEKTILKIFSHTNITFVDFVKKCEKNPNDVARILAYAGRSNCNIARYLMKHRDIPVYIRTKNYQNIYPQDQIAVSKNFSQSVATFELTEENNSPLLLYALKVFQDDELLGLNVKNNERDVMMLSNEPCCAVVKGHLCVFETMNFSKLKPFFAKEYVRIESKLINDYMHSFVYKQLKEGNVISKGFEVEKVEPVMRPQLVLKNDLKNDLALQLKFIYDDFEVDEFTSSQRLVKEVHEKGRYKFRLLVRDVAQEEEYRKRILDLGLRTFNGLFYLQIKDYDNRMPIYAMVDKLLASRHLIPEYEIKQEQEEGVYMLSPISASVKIFDNKCDWFEITGDVQLGDFVIPFYKFRQHIILGKREYKLPDGTIAILPEEWFVKYSDIMKFAVERDNSLYIQRYYFNLLDELPKDTTNGYWIALEEEREVPQGINAELRPYQKVGYSWLVSLYENGFGGCLADDMGLGKTLQFLTFFQYVYYGKDGVKSIEQNTSAASEPIVRSYESSQPSLFDQLFVEPTAPAASSAEKVSAPASVPAIKKPASLVVLPTSLLFNWAREKEKFAPNLKSLVYSGSKRVRSKDIGRIFNHYDLVFTTYGTIRNDFEYIKDYTFDCIVLDESQNIKNPESYNYKSVIMLKANHHYVITGTPIENSLNDLWAQMNFANRNIFGTQTSFRDHFIHPIVKLQNEERKIKLQQLIKPFILRRTKSEVAKDLPPMIEQTIVCEMTEEHSKLYNQEKSTVRNSIIDTLINKGDNPLIALTALLRLRQLSNHPVLVKEDYEGESSKLEEVVARVESLWAENHKVLIFSSFVKHLHLVGDRLSKMGINYEMLTGETVDREQAVNNFQNNPDIACFLISLKAGGVGLNLIAADYVFLLDPWWNSAAESQAINRAHRIGQDKTVMVYRFIMADTIEEKIQNLQQSKAELAQTFINSNNPFADISLEELQKLFDN